MAERAHIRYSSLPTDDNKQRTNRRTSTSRPHHDDDEEDDIRFSYSPRERVPWKSIALALFLLSFGCFSLLVSHFIFTGHMGGDTSQAYGFLALGFLTFLPGFYETRIAYYSWRGFKGYTFSRIPDY